MPRSFDAIVIGAGISGAAAAYELAEGRRVLMLEAESRPGYHSTGRSAALYTPNYGNAVVRALILAGRPFLDRPPAGFTDQPMTKPRGAITIAGPADDAIFEERLALSGPGHEIHEISPDEAVRRVPILRREVVARALYETDIEDMDVARIHQGFLTGFRHRGGELVCDARADRIERRPDGWEIRAGDVVATAPVLVNAAGAWADEVATLAGLPPVGLVPKRRTAILVDLPPGADPASWPALDDCSNEHYFRPDSGTRLMVSPADETPSPPCDAQPDEMDVAYLVDWLERTTTLQVRRLPHQWAGLRSFVADHSPVVGPDPLAPGFYWLAGQGGYGIMLASPLARGLKGLIDADALPADLIEQGATAAALAPRRPGLASAS
ncbi:MAG TPA: FAD-binding oxidoreductase [Hypericibacter adhaerens]|uniref:FAD-dependent catabolic D-arginine dehydrogenase DauA n=1 Tax=Hypericibacter adhaerens TaxID=2602016 RepID=A0A5J6N5D8_9PROT|nr:FAD-binding oxidoreductase [Hypericibacter adhaerens]QEX24095.1 FAD-dependent catabolic D-arginine dehydrogenase DauA [Hypericibacter adhaerens]HWA42796.1 FAD-binding oxidoreductase [Hypericibacter adhaerens]